MTPRQLRVIYAETYRQEAREKLKWISILQIPKITDKAKFDGAIYGIKLQAYPPDPYADGEMNDEKLLNLKRMLEQGGVKVEEPNESSK